MPNRLAHETSPYLLQHADNPVDWWPWSAEAFEEARRRNVPVLLSVGYSSCHWCHVMAHESFEDDAIAALVNEHFVAVKVDREERPDIDAVYIDAEERECVVLAEGGERDRALDDLARRRVRGRTTLGRKCGQQLRVAVVPCRRVDERP